MLRFFHRNLHLCNYTPRDPSFPIHLRFLHTSLPTHIPESLEPTNPASLTVSYLTSSCGVPLSAALSASKKLRLKSTQNADSVLVLLKSHGFTSTQIANIFARHPKLLSCSPEEVVKPKLQFFLDSGYSLPDLTKLITADPNLLVVSLKNRLIPNFDLLKSVLGTGRNVAAALSCSTWLLRCNPETTLLSKIKILRDHGVPGSNIAKLVILYPRVLMQSSARFGRTVERLKEMGFNPLTMMFVYGVNAMSGLSKLTWERKLAVYESLGWSEKETILAFRKHPFCMLLSDEKIRRAMDFFVNKLHWEASFVSEHPKLLAFSLEKRTVPRSAVMNVLASRGLLSRNLGGQTYLMITENRFLEKYVMKYKDQAPELLEAYQGKIDFVGLDRKI